MRYSSYENLQSLLVVLVMNGFESSIQVKNTKSLVLIRRENSGLDFGAYTAGLAEFERLVGSESLPLHYGFLNCGMTGPFLPTFLPPSFDWFAAFTNKLSRSVRLVGSYITCLLPSDAGGHGPRVEGHSFFTDLEGLSILREARVMRQMKNKYDAIVNGEYGLTRAVFDAGYTIDTLLYKYQGVNWRDKSNWDCNMNRFVGRGGGYEGGNVNPFEVIFFKRVWPTIPDERERTVRYEETSRYMSWRSQWENGLGGVHSDNPPPPPPPPFYPPT